jgi:hypothetical protein
MSLAILSVAFSVATTIVAIVASAVIAVRVWSPATKPAPVRSAARKTNDR